jgi:transposase-like protein
VHAGRGADQPALAFDQTEPTPPDAEHPRRGTRADRHLARQLYFASAVQDLGIHPEAPRKSVQQTQADNARRRILLTSEDREELKQLRTENFELRRANATLKDASVSRLER